jgi:sirohydrochlorin cobaltochelatase
MAALVAGRLAVLGSQFDIPLHAASVAIVGHGTRRHQYSRRATEQLAQALDDQVADRVFAVFLDEEPAVREILKMAARDEVVVIPFMIGAGPHAIKDIPARMGLTVAAETEFPYAGEVDGRRVICDAPVGSDPRIVELIADLANAESAGITSYKTMETRA